MVYGMVCVCGGGIWCGGRGNDVHVYDTWCVCVWYLVYVCNTWCLCVRERWYGGTWLYVIHCVCYMFVWMFDVCYMVW